MMKTYIKQIDGQWYSFAGDVDRYQVYSIGRDNPRDGRWIAKWTNNGIQYVATPSPSKKAAIAKAKRWDDDYAGEDTSW